MIAFFSIYDRQKKYAINFEPRSYVDICKEFNYIRDKRDVEPDITIDFYDRMNNLLLTLVYSYSGCYYSKNGSELKMFSDTDIFESNRRLVAEFLREIVERKL